LLLRFQTDFAIVIPVLVAVLDVVDQKAPV